jgi:RNA polymerase sigma-70 factor (ECF subfamily)
MAADVDAAVLSDEEILRRVAKGEAGAFRILVERHADRWHSLAFRLLGRRDTAEDVVQDVFLRLWSRPAAFRPLGARFSTWAHRVVVNRCLDRIRMAGEASMRGIEVEPSDPAPDALSRLIEAEREHILQAEIARLPERQRVALVLVYSSGLSDKEAAKVMDVSLKAFEALLVRAKRALRLAVAPSPGDGR